MELDMKLCLFLNEYKKRLNKRKMPTFIGCDEQQTLKLLKYKLNDKQYKVFKLYYLKEMGIDEISNIMGMETSKVKNFIINLRDKVKTNDPKKPQNPNLDPETGRFIKGSKAWNKGKYGYMGANKTSFTKDDVKPAAIGVPRQGHNHLVTTSDETRPTKSYNGKIYNNHARVSYPRYLLKKQGIDVPSNFVVWHIDGDYTNNDLGNLELISRAEALARNSKMRKRVK